MVPITGRASSFLEKNLFFKNRISIKIKSKINPNYIHSFFCSSFFLCLPGQPELCGSYHLLQSCFSFFVYIHGQPEPFGSCIILQSCSSFFFHLHGQPELAITFSSPVSHGLLFLRTFSFPFMFYLFRVCRHDFLPLLFGL